MQNLFVLIALGFAAYRATQFVLFDSITEGPRQRLELWHARKYQSKVRAFIRALFNCLYCIGYWLSGVTLLAYLLASGQWGEASWLVHGIEWWVVAGIQALLNRHDS